MSSTWIQGVCLCCTEAVEQHSRGNDHLRESVKFSTANVFLVLFYNFNIFSYFKTRRSLEKEPLGLDYRFFSPLQDVSMVTASLSFPYPSKEKARTLKLYSSHSSAGSQACVLLPSISAPKRKPSLLLPFLNNTWYPWKKPNCGASSAYSQLT